MKKILLFLMTFLIVFTPISVLAGECNDPNLKRVVDEAGVLSSAEEEELEEYIKTIRDKYEEDIVVVFVNSTNGKSNVAYADDFFDYEGYGYGSKYDGIIYLVNMEKRTTQIETCGESIVTFTDYGCDYINEHSDEYLSEGDYYGAVKYYAKTCGDFMKQADEGKPYDYGNEYNKKKSYLIYILSELAVWFVGFISSVSGTASLKSKMNRVQKAVKASNYVVNPKPLIASEEATFLRKNVNKVVIASSSSGSGHHGSTTHRSSSGRSHGGSRGGRF